MKLLMSSRGAVLPWGLEDESRHWVSRQDLRNKISRWLGNQIGGAGKILAIPKDRLVN
jgi:hypothetical protein